MIRGSIDLGTNTCLLLITEWALGEREPIRVLCDEANVVRLGQGVDAARSFHPDAITRTLTCLKSYSEIAKKNGLAPEKIIAVATSQARDSQNALDFFKRVGRETGIQFRILSGDDEARFTFDGAILPQMSAKQTAVIDIGGGSTEITMDGKGLSLDVGSVRFTERYLVTQRNRPVTDEQFWACQEAVDQALEGFRGLNLKGRELLAVAGTATTLAQWFLGQKIFKASEIDQVELTAGDLHRMVEELKWRSPEEREQLPGVTAGRADVLLAGALILWRTLENLGFPKTRVSTRGLRYGVLRALN